MSSIQIRNQDKFKDELLKNRSTPSELWKALKFAVNVKSLNTRSKSKVALIKDCII